MNKFYVINNGSRHLRSLRKFLARYGKVEVIKLAKIDIRQIPDDGLVVLSGSHKMSVLWHQKYYAKEIELIKNHRGPLIGICLGAQLIAHVYGSHLHFLGQRQRGLRLITDQNNQTHKVFEAHAFSINKVVPPLVELARSDDGVEMFRHCQLPIYGLQFHPESSRGSDGQRILTDVIRQLTNA